MSRIRGFTLIEMMISLVILSMLLGVATFSYQMLTSRWQKGLEAFEINYVDYRDQELLHRVLTGIYPYVVTNNDGTPSFFFCRRRE